MEKSDIMTNNTTTNTTDNMTGGLTDGGLLEQLPLELLMVVAVLAVLAFVAAWMKVPTFRMLVRKQYAKFMRAHQEELDELYEKFLTTAQKAKLDVKQAAIIKAAILEKAILAEVDHKAKDVQASLTKEIRDMAKKL